MEVSSSSNRFEENPPKPSQPSTKNQTISFSRSGFSHLRSLGDGPDPPGRLISIVSDRIYTLGRDKRRCDIIVRGRCVSRLHCQFFLDASDRKLKLVDGFLLCSQSMLSEARQKFRPGILGSKTIVSRNGVFVNGRRLCGAVAELGVGNLISFGCGNVFMVERIVFSGKDWSSYARKVFDSKREVVSHGLAARKMGSLELQTKVQFLLRQCTSILQAADPVSYIRSHLALGIRKRSATLGSNVNLDSERCSNLDARPLGDPLQLIELKNSNPNALRSDENGVLLDPTMRVIDKNDPSSHAEKGTRTNCQLDGRMFFLNRLVSQNCDSVDHHNVVSLLELLCPVKNLVRVFIATFTSDVPWFLSCCQPPNHLPITIACHSSERCWSSIHDRRTSRPFSNYPNLLLVYPQFPDTIAFGGDRQKQGVACHHPKLFVLQREDSIRVIITSANLVSRQWNNVTNTVWWQDFPRRNSPDYSSLFATSEYTKSDFAAQLAGFIASLISDVPSQAHWPAEITKFDFSGAAGHLVASVPGVHAQKSSYTSADHCLSAKQIERLHSNTREFLGSVHSSVVGLSYRFRAAVDSTGTQLKYLAAILGKSRENASGLTEVLLKRNNNIAADVNAVSVLVADLDEFSEGDCVQLGFLPRDVAKWVSPLSDNGFFRFSAFLYPKEVLGVALEGSSRKVQLILYVSQGPKFSEISRLIQPDHLSPLCLLLASMQRCVGLWRLEEVLSQYKWPESLETDFFYASSSIGTSVNPQFLAAFAAAAGKKSCQYFESDESDPEWGCWSAKHEERNPSLKIVFPTIERVKNSACGVLASRYLLSFSEKTWQRLRTRGILYDAIPHPEDRVRFPMHIKVACRSFQSKTNKSSCGWIYCGSHNFSPAAWGQIIHPSSELKVPGATPINGLSPKLHICNYELGILLVSPPSKASDEANIDLDKVKLPFVIPAPRYHDNDKPATAQAMREALVEADTMRLDPSLAELATEEVDNDVPDEVEQISDTADYVAEEREEEKIYAEMLWSEVNSSQS